MKGGERGLHESTSIRNGSSLMQNERKEQLKERERGRIAEGMFRVPLNAERESNQEWERGKVVSKKIKYLV